MPLFQNWFRGNSQTVPEKATSGPEFLAELLVAQFLFDKRPIIADEELARLTDSFASDLRRLLEPWILVYLAWLLRVFATKQYGEAFGREMMVSMYERVSSDKDHSPPNSSTASGIEFWFGQLDKTLREVIENPITIKGEPVPPSRFFALCFLSRDSASPYCNDRNPNFQGIDLRVARTLDDALNIAKPRIDGFIGKAADMPR